MPAIQPEALLCQVMSDPPGKAGTLCTHHHTLLVEILKTDRASRGSPKQMSWTTVALQKLLPTLAQFASTRQLLSVCRLSICRLSSAITITLHIRTSNASALSRQQQSLLSSPGCVRPFRILTAPRQPRKRSGTQEKFCLSNIIGQCLAFNCPNRHNRTTLVVLTFLARAPCR